MPEYIEKFAVINALIDVENRAQGKYRKSWKSLYRDLCETEIRIGKMPAADVAPVVHGRWEHLGGDEWCCTHCGCVISTEGSWEKPEKKYCDNCGAKMDLGD